MPFDQAELEQAAARAQEAKAAREAGTGVSAQEERIQLEKARALEEGFEERPAPEGEEPKKVTLTADELDRCSETIRNLTDRAITLQAELNQYYEAFGPLPED